MFLEQTGSKYKAQGWIELICGSMFSGKTEELLRRVKRADIAGLKCLHFKPNMDKRFKANAIVSHDQNAIGGIPVNYAFDILDHVTEETQVVAIDEAQFLDNAIIDVANILADRGVRTIIAGLDMDFNGQPFGAMPALMANAEYVTKLHAICVSCGALAQFSHRKSEELDQVILGEKEKYEPLCRKCYQKSKE